MKITVNKKEITPYSYKLLADSTLLNREFNIKVRQKVCSIGDEVEIFDFDGNLFIKAVVEVVDNLTNGFSIVSGRDKVKQLYDKTALKTKQFKKSSSLKAIFSSVLEGLDINIIGDFHLPQEERVIINKGVNLAQFCLNLAINIGVSLHSNADGDLVIKTPDKTKKMDLNLGDNLESGNFIDNVGDAYDKIVVVGSDAITPNNPENKYYEAETGTGDKVKVYQYPVFLSKKECLDIAKRFLYQNERKKGKYIGYLGYNINLDLGDICLIKDENRNINKEMRVFRIERTLSENIEDSSFKVFFEVPPNV